MNNITKVLLSILILAVPYALKAQEVEEVVVTATKKSESIQDLALSIEALTSEDIELNMVQDAEDLAEVVPGLITAKGIGSGASYAIRGTGSYGVGAAVVGAASVESSAYTATDPLFEASFTSDDDLNTSKLFSEL